VAVTVDAVGPSSSGQASASATALTWTHTAGAGGTAVLAWVGCVASDGVALSSITVTVTYGGTPMTLLAPGVPAGGPAATTAGGIFVFGLTGAPAGASTVSVTVSGDSGNAGGNEGGSVSYNGAGGFGTPGTAGSNGAAVASGTVSAAGTASGNLVAAGVVCGSGPGVTFTAPAAGDVSCANNSLSGAGYLGISHTASSSGTVSTAWTQTSDYYGAVAVEVVAAGAAPAVAPQPQPQPGGRAYRRRWRRAQQRVLTTAPAAAPAQFTEAGAAADSLGVSSAVTLTESGAGADRGPLGPPYIAGLGGGTGTAGYFTDQYGNPRILWLEMAWGLPGNAGRWNSGNWQSDMDAYFAARASQGYTGWWGVPWINTIIDPGAVHADGRTWDGIYPLTVNGTPGSIATGSETLGLNGSFWARTDYMVSSALRNGITVFLNLGMGYDFSQSGFIWQHLSTTQAQAFGALVAARYPQGTYPNLQWVFGDDTLAGAYDTYFSAMLTGVRGTGDTRNAVAVEQLLETNCHIEFDTGAVYVPGGFGVTSAQWNHVYTYCPPYLAVEDSYTESGTTLIPVVWGDGAWHGDTDNGTPEYTIRRQTWWALASGARGVNQTAGPSNAATATIWTWQSGAAAGLASDPAGPWCTTTGPAVSAYFTSLPGWHKLVPDTGSALVTSGRGSKSTSAAPGFTPANSYGDTDNYVAASRVSDGSLAVIYCGQHFSITIDQAKMAAGYTATWVDPSSLAVTAATAGSSYNSTPQGNNSAGNPDWVLVLQASVTAASLPEAGSGTDALAVSQPAGLSEPGTASDALALAGPAPLAETGAAAAALAVVQPAPFTEAGAGADAPGIMPGLADTGQAADTLAVTLASLTGLTDAGAGTDSLAVAQPAPLTETGAGSDALALAQPAGLPEAGAGADALAIAEPASLTESGTGTDLLGTVPGLAESAGGADALAVSQPAPLSEAGTGTDAIAVSQPAAFPESGTGDGLPAVTQPTGLAGSGTGSEALSVTLVTLAGLTEGGSGADALAAVPVAPLSESGTGADALGAMPGLTGTGAGADALALAQPAALTEGGTGDGLLTLAQFTGLAEPGAVTDTLGISQAAAVALAESGAGGPEQLGVMPGLADTGTGSGSLALAQPAGLTEAGAGDETLALAQSASLAEAGAGADSLGIPSLSVISLGEAGAGSDTLAVTAGTVPLTDAGAGTDSLAVMQPGTGSTGTVTWTAHPAPPRWRASPAPPRWRIIMALFEPIAAISLEEVNVTWLSRLAGTTVDPTGVSEGSTLLPVQMAFPVSSGNPALPAEPVTWFAASWLLGGTSIGYIAQALVGPGGTVTLTAGMTYDCWSKISGAPESPAKFAGSIEVY
jgi:hypothetical protein